LVHAVVEREQMKRLPINRIAVGLVALAAWRCPQWRQRKTVLYSFKATIPPIRLGGSGSSMGPFMEAAS